MEIRKFNPFLISEFKHRVIKPMLKVNVQSEYKNFVSANNPYLQRIEILNSDVSPLCFNRNSITQNFFSQPDNYFLNRHVEALDISHKRMPSPFKDPNIKFLPDKDFINSALSEFDDYKRFHSDNPVIAVCSDEGKPVNFRLFSRFENPLRNISDLSFGLDNYKGKGVFLTLTYKHDITLREAWENVSHDWNAFNSRLIIELRKNPYQTHLFKHKNRVMSLDMRLDYYKGILHPSMPTLSRSDLHYVMVLEAQGNGYPHIHVLFLGIDYLFWAGNKQEYINDNPHSKNLKHFWSHGSIFVNRTKSGNDVKNPIRYMMKYIRKIWDNEPDYKAKLTQAMLWYFGLNSFNPSQNLKQFLHIGMPLNSCSTMLYRSKTMVLDLYLNYNSPVPKSLNFEGLDLYKKLNGDITPVVWAVKPAYPFYDLKGYTDKIKNTDKNFKEFVSFSGRIYSPKKPVSPAVHRLPGKTSKRFYDSLFVETYGLLEYGFILNRLSGIPGQPPAVLGAWGSPASPFSFTGFSFNK